MATTVEVSTWGEIVSNLNGTMTDDILTLKLTKNIDCNKEIPEGVASTIKVKARSGAKTRVVIDGSYTENDEEKNYEIRNLRTHVSSPVNIFEMVTNGSAKPTILFKNIDFVNLLLMGTGTQLFLKTGNDVSTSNYYNTFENCRLVGKRSRMWLYGHSDNPYTVSTDSLRMISCFVNMPYVDANPDAQYQRLCKSSTANFSHQADYCHFVDTYGGWTPTTDGMLLYRFNLNGCYIEGDIVGNVSNGIRVTTAYAYDSPMQNVVDCRLLSKDAPSETISVYAPKGIWKDKISPFDNPESSTTYAYTNQNAAAIPCTPAEMLSPSDLADKDFDIVVPSP